MLQSFNPSAISDDGREDVLESLACAITNLDTLSDLFKVFAVKPPPPLVSHPPPQAIPIHTPPVRGVDAPASPRREAPGPRSASEAFGIEEEGNPPKKVDEDGDEKWDDEDYSLFNQSRTRFKAAHMQPTPNEAEADVDPL